LLAKMPAMEVTLDDVSSVIRLVREVYDRWDDPAAWREHLLSGACRLLDGNVGMMLADYRSEPGWFGELAVVSVTGLPEPMRNLLEPAYADLGQRQFTDIEENLWPGVVNLYGQMSKQGWATAAGNQLTDEATYHSSAVYQGLRKKIDCDDYVVSVRIVDVPRRPEAISIDRPHGAPPFAAREVALLKLLHDEIAPLVGVRLTTENHVSRNGLSKRLRETLSLLLEGQSEKQIATAMNLSGRTVHDYVTRLYEHFRVCSRAELLAYFIRRQPIARERA
jgi:DNA-binding CsgD family transcriptional regulator